MSFKYDEFYNALQKGFIDKDILSNENYLPQVLTNNSIKKQKVLTTILKELNSCEQFIFSVAFLTKSGVATLMNTLLELEKKGIKGKILVSQYQNFTQPEALKTLLKFSNIELKISVENSFHAKGYLFKKNSYYNIIIGSSNLTANALCRNREWNLKVSATDNSKIIEELIEEIDIEFENAITVDNVFIDFYQFIYDKQRKQSLFNNLSSFNSNSIKIKPNRMQQEALNNLKKIRESGKNRALLISATGTGKTYLAAFDVLNFNSQKTLFIVHRANIAKRALDSFKKILNNPNKTFGLLSGDSKDIDADYIFATVQTLSKEESLKKLSTNYFDYIIIDETHRAGANSYLKIVDYFKPKFLLGMSATPERGDGFDIFNLFDYNIAYEIRVQQALEEDMLSPFHYYGISDIYFDEQKDNLNYKNFSYLTSDERVKHIIDKIKLYGTDSGVIRGLIFCSSIDESKELSKKFNQQGYKTVSLSSENSEIEREMAIEKLESDNFDEKLDYILSVDIFNEGVDIPKLNQIIMLRATQSVIVFVQQLGRGLRKSENKEYLTVLDFIGNYSNNYLIPMALYGDSSYNKERLRKLIISGNIEINGASTVNFDLISKERVFKSINSANMDTKKELVNDYNNLKFKIGKTPFMIDFINFGSRDPYLFVKYSKSYFNFISNIENQFENTLSQKERKYIELISSDIANGKFIEEVYLLLALINRKTLSISQLKTELKNRYNIGLRGESLDINKENFIDKIGYILEKNLNFKFVTEIFNKKATPIGDIYNIDVVEFDKEVFRISNDFNNLLENSIFKKFITDILETSIKVFEKNFIKDRYFDGFILYNRYSRKDVFRALSWDKNPNPQLVGGYIVSNDKSNCAVFINYHKDENISSSKDYNDGFIDKSHFRWMSKTKRNINSPDVKDIKNGVGVMRMPLFIRKTGDEGNKFYYMGDVNPIENHFEQKYISSDSGEKLSVIEMILKLKYSIEDDIYEYLIYGGMNSRV